VGFRTTHNSLGGNILLRVNGYLVICIFLILLFSCGKGNEQSAKAKVENLTVKINKFNKGYSAFIPANVISKVKNMVKDTGIYSDEKVGKKNYRKVTLNILTHENPVIGLPTELHANQFSKLTGAIVKVYHVPFNRLYQEALRGLKVGKYDIVFYGSLWIADMQKYLEPLPKEMVQSKQFRAVMPHYKEIATWKGKYYQVPIDGDRHYFQFRSDIIGNNIFKREYRLKYKKKLKLPQTWKELNKVASFFNGKIVDGSKKIYGLCEITKVDDLLFSQFIKRAASYAKHPNVKGGFYFELKTMKPLINNPGFVEALKDFIASTYYYPPSGLKFSLADVISSFGNGNTVFTDGWDDSFTKAMEAKSKIRNKVATALSLGSKKVWNRRTKRWDVFATPNVVPYVAWGWTSAVAKNSKNKKAAFDYLGFFANNHNHSLDMLIGEFGVNPFRKSDLNVKFWQKGAKWNYKVANNYINTLLKINRSRSRVIDLRIYLGRQYMHALAVGVFRSITKRTTPQKALDEVARIWNQLNKRIGIDKQRNAYASIVKYEDRMRCVK